MKITFDDDEIMAINKVAEETGIDGFDLIEDYQNAKATTLEDDMREIAKTHKTE
ncbi:MAG: hypothetical protein IKE94_12080 [Aeriscardovia sp.]|nr:hypothetical protein [Aeriscardovia sp.]MBR2658812.1 hypothetical protein [Candidatus Saccharibacteria bacterium]